MKNCSFKWLLSTMLLITATAIFSLTSTAIAKSPTPTSPEVKISPTDLPVVFNTTNNYQLAVNEKENGTTMNDRKNFAETPAILKMPQIYAKKISYASGNTAMTGKNYRGKQPFNRMM